MVRRTTRSTRGRVRVALCVALIATGCAQTFDATRLGMDATMAAPAGNQPPGETFAVSRKSVWAFWGLVPLSRASLQRVLAAQLTGDAKVTNLSIRVRSRFWDLVPTLLTGGLIVPRTVTYEGVIVP